MLSSDPRKLSVFCGTPGWKRMWCAAVLSLCCPGLASNLSAGVSPSVDLICTNLLPSAEPTGSYSDLLITCLTQNRGIDRIQAHALLNHSKYKKLQLTSCKDIFTVCNSILLRLFLLQLPAHPENFLALKFSLPPLFLHLANLNKNIFCHFHCPLAPEVPRLTDMFSTNLMLQGIHGSLCWKPPLELES